MATQEEVEILLKQLKKAPPSDGLKNIDKAADGIHAVLQYLYETNETVTAGKISEQLGVSTARVAVILKKMTVKGLIIKETDASDGRVVVVKLSEAGRASAQRIRANICAQAGMMIDQIGMERMLQFAEISKEIHELLKHTPFDFDL